MSFKLGQYLGDPWQQIGQYIDYRIDKLKNLIIGTTISSAASIADVNAGTSTTKFVTPASLSGSKLVNGGTYDYYVSSTIGNDAYSGTTPDSPKKTLTAVAALITAGKTLGIEKGSYFREQLYINVPNVAIGTYNSGSNITVANFNPNAKPILDASDIIPAANITKTPALTNVYQFNVTPVTVGGQSFSFFENGQRLVRVASNATCDSTVGSFFAPTPSNGVSQTIVFHAIGNTNGTSDGKLYECTTRDTGFDTGPLALNTTVDGIITKRSLQNDGTMRLSSSGAYVKNCNFIDGSKHNIFVSDNSTVENCTALNCEGYDSMFIYYIQDATSAKGTTFKNCNAIGAFAYGAQTTAYPTSVGFYNHTQTSVIPVVNYINCYAENLSSGFSGEALINNVTNCRTNLVATSFANLANANGISNITSCFFDQRYGAAYQQASNDNRALIQVAQGTINIKGSVLIANPGTFGHLIYSPDANTIINATSNTFAGLNATGNTLDGIQKLNTGVINLDKNIFYGVSNPIDDYANNLMSAIATNNVYYRSTGNLVWKNGANTYTGFPAWQASGQDLNGLNIDPAFAAATSSWTKVSDAAPTNAAVVSLKIGATYYTP